MATRRSEIQIAVTGVDALRSLNSELAQFEKHGQTLDGILGKLNNAFTTGNRTVDGMTASQGRALIALQKTNTALLQNVDASLKAGTAARKNADDTAQATREASLAFNAEMRLASAMRLVGGEFTAAGAAIVGAYGRAVRAGMDFNRQLQVIQANTGISNTELGQLRSTVENIGTSYGGAMDKMAAGGMHAVNLFHDMTAAQAITTAGAKAAIATHGNEEQTINGLAKTMKEWSLATSQSGETMNGLLVAANRANTTLPEMMNHTDRIRATFANLKLPLSDMLALFATLTQHGLSAAQSETQLLNVTQKIVQPSKQVRDVIDMLVKTVDPGLKKAFSLEGIQRDGFEGLFKRLEADAKALKVPVSELIEKLFPNLRGILAALIFSGTGIADLRKNTELFQGAFSRQTELNTAVKQSQDQLATSVDKLHNRYIVVSEDMARSMTPGLMSMMGAIDKVFKAFEQLSPATRSFLEWGGLAAGVTFVVTGRVLGLASSFYQLRTAILAAEASGKGGPLAALMGADGAANRGSLLAKIGPVGMAAGFLSLIPPEVGNPYKPETLPGIGKFYRPTPADAAANARWMKDHGPGPMPVLGPPTPAGLWEGVGAGKGIASSLASQLRVAQAANGHPAPDGMSLSDRMQKYGEGQKAASKATKDAARQAKADARDAARDAEEAARATEEAADRTADATGRDEFLKRRHELNRDIAGLRASGASQASLRAMYAAVGSEITRDELTKKLGIEHANAQSDFERVKQVYGLGSPQALEQASRVDKLARELATREKDTSALHAMDNGTEGAVADRARRIYESQLDSLGFRVNEFNGRLDSTGNGMPEAVDSLFGWKRRDIGADVERLRLGEQEGEIDIRDRGLTPLRESQAIRDSLTGRIKGLKGDSELAGTEEGRKQLVEWEKQLHRTNAEIERIKQQDFDKFIGDIGRELQQEFAREDFDFSLTAMPVRNRDRFRYEQERNTQERDRKQSQMERAQRLGDLDGAKSAEDEIRRLDFQYKYTAGERLVNRTDEIADGVTSGMIRWAHGDGSLKDVFRGIGDKIMDTSIEKFLRPLIDPMSQAVAKQILAVEDNTTVLQSLTDTLNGTGGSGGSVDANSPIPKAVSTGMAAALAAAGVVGGVTSSPAGLTPRGSGSGRSAGTLPQNMGKWNTGDFLTAGSAAYSVYENGAAHGVTLGNVLAAGATGYELGGPVGAGIGVGLDLLGGIFGHKHTPSPQETTPSVYNGPSGFEYEAYRLRVTGKQPSASSLHLAQTAEPKINVTVVMDGVKQAVRTVQAESTSLSGVSRASSFFDLHRPT